MRRLTAPSTSLLALQRFSLLRPIVMQPVSLTTVPGVIAPVASPASAVIGLKIEPVG